MAAKGRWAKWFASVVVDKGHYDDAQFRAFASLVAEAASAGPVWKSREVVIAFLDRNVVGSTGPELFAFLAGQGDIKVRRGGRVELVGFAKLHAAPVDRTGAARQARYRDRQKAVRVTDPVTVPSNHSTSFDPPSPFERDAVTDRHSSLSDSPVTPRRSSTRKERAPAELDGFVALAGVVEELTGRPYALANPYGGIGGMAAKLIEDFGLERTLTAVRRAGKVIDHPDARALIFSANDALRPVVSGKALAAEERREEVAASNRLALERTRARLRESQEWLADAGPAVHDGGRKTPALPPVLPPRVSRTGDTP